MAKAHIIDDDSYAQIKVIHINFLITRLSDRLRDNLKFSGSLAGCQGVGSRNRHTITNNRNK